MSVLIWFLSHELWTKTREDEHKKGCGNLGRILCLLMQRRQGIRTKWCTCFPVCMCKRTVHKHTTQRVLWGTSRSWQHEAHLQAALYWWNKTLLLSRRSVLLHITICYYPFALNSVGRLDLFCVHVSFSLHTSHHVWSVNISKNNLSLHGSQHS